MTVAIVVNDSLLVVAPLDVGESVVEIVVVIFWSKVSVKLGTETMKVSPFLLVIPLFNTVNFFKLLHHMLHM